MNLIHRLPWPSGKSKKMAASGDLGSLIYQATFDTVGLVTETDRMNWPVDDLGDADLDWSSGDGKTPNKGPSPLTQDGTPGDGVDTAWRDAAAAAITCTKFWINESFRSATSIDPAENSDWVFLGLFRPWYGNTLTPAVLFSTLSEYGFEISYVSSVLSVTITTVNGTIILTADVGACTWLLVGVTYDASGNAVLYVDGHPADAEAAPGKTVGTAAGFGINARINGSKAYQADIVRVMFWTGAGIAATATDAWHAAVAEAVLGIRPSVGDAGSVYYRASTTVYYPTGDPDDRLHLLGPHMPPAGGIDGLGADEQIVSQGSKNYAFKTGDEADVTVYDHSSGSEERTLIPVIIGDLGYLSGTGLRELGTSLLQLKVKIMHTDVM